MTTICLNMIVKNESHIIKKTLINIINCVKIDYWVICDTGSSDNTIEIIEEFFEELNIPGEIHKHVWKDFSHNRNLSLKQAYNKSDYLFIFDADDEIHGNFKLPTEFKYDNYMVIFGGGYSYRRTAIINNRKKWKYFGVLHEVIIGQEEMTDADTITGDYHFISGRNGSRSMNVNKYHEDAILLENAFDTTNEAWIKERYAFYCAQSYKDAKIFDEAIKWYKKTLELHGWNQEKFYASYMIGVLEENKNNLISAISYYLLSLTYDKTRWEGLYSALQLLLKTNQYNLASILVNGIELNNLINPRDGSYLFINDSIHDYKMYILIIIIAFKTNNIEQGRRAQLKLYDNFEYLPQQISKDTIYNGQYFIPEDKDIQDYLNRTMVFIQKYSYKYMTSLPDNAMLETYIKKYNEIFDYKGEYRPSQQSSINIILTITSCKRSNLLRRTIKSMTRNWKDFSMVDKIVCIDDGTEKKELSNIVADFPWIEFIVKDATKRGHRGSMNMIRDIVINSGAKYWIHIEDDWEFIKSANYISRGIEYMRKYSDIDVKQLLFNKGYAEIISDITWKCGTRLEEGLLLHKHDASDSPCGYWPHYSFRPGITCVDVLKNLGDFNTPNQFFELDYANKYICAGYKTVYLDEITCIHIGKLAGKRGESDKQNSYELNNISQGIQNDIESHPFYDSILNNKGLGSHLPIKVINLKRRLDRREYMKGLLKNVKFDFKDAIDGRLIPSNDPRLASFIGNDFNNNPGTIGCAISHIELWQELMEDTTTNYYIIMEDDIKLKTNWYTDLYTNKNSLNNSDVVMLGYSMFDNVRQNVRSLYDNNDTIQLYNLDLDKYIGGFFCYSINKTGAQKILQSMSLTGIKHGIDYLAIKTISGLVKKEIRPQIAFTEWNEGGKQIDTDIQNSSESLKIDPIITKEEGIVCFIHSCYIEQCGLYRLRNLIETIIKSGLYDKLDALYICNIGLSLSQRGNSFIDKDKIHIYNLSNNINEYEATTLNLIHKYSEEYPTTKILYLHTKGLLTIHNECVNDWIKLMLYFNVERYTDCISKLNNVDCLGVNWLENHFSGNFWWANAKHILTRKIIVSDQLDLTHKMKAEYFLCDSASYYKTVGPDLYYNTEDGAKIVSLHQSNINHFQSLYPRTLYTDSDNIQVGIITNYCSSEEACIEFGKLGKQHCMWNNIELVSPQSNKCDYLIIINKPAPDMEGWVKQFDKRRIIIFQMEPWCENKSWGVNTWGYWAEPDPNEYLGVIGRKTHTYNNAFWQLEQSYLQLKEPITKTNIISSICSSKYFDPGHIKRIDFLKYIESKSNAAFDVDIFNIDNKHNFRNYKGPVYPFINKSKGLIQYKYYFMCENNFESGFITEKLWEPILCETLVFYCGAPDVSKYVDPLSFVEIDIYDFDKSYEIIVNAIQNGLYEKRLPYIRKMKNKILNEIQFFPRIEKIINGTI